MQRTGSRFPGQFQLSDQKSSTEREKLTVSERDQLSPVALTTRAATPLSLSPLQWSHYDSTPDAVYAKNTGFTVMIQASFQGEVPHISSGPLAENYNFSQIHFHWGEHDEIGSGHSVDEVRYPLEMHVVHVKKECANLKEASGAKDGIAIAVHLFSLREERNTHLDQLTAVLQFIQKPKCCAKLYPSSLSEIVYPFSKDYFLYWGAVPGSSKQNYRIVWLVSRDILPVSSQQLEQFRELRNDQGHFIWSNSNDPHPLGDRSLFLVSPSEKTNETIVGVSRKPTRSVMTLVSDKSIELHDAEFKSLVTLQDAEVGSCAICPHPNHAEYKATTNLKPVRINEGDTSVEESCVDLGLLQESTVKTELKSNKENNNEKPTNDNITACGNSCSAKYIPSQDRYSVISANEKEIHLKRKQLFIRKSEPSTEQACVFLNKAPSVHSAQSAPSLTTWGYLGLQKEYMDVSKTQQTNNSSEVIVCSTNMESGGITEHVKNNKTSSFSDHYKIEAKPENVETKSKFKDASTQNSGNTSIGKEHLVTPPAKYPSSKISRQSPDEEEKKVYPGEVFDDIFQTEYLLVKQAEPKKSFYRVIGELLMTPDSKRTFVKRESNTNEAVLAEISDKSQSHSVKEKSTPTYNNKKTVLSFPSLAKTNQNQVVENSNFIKIENDNKINRKESSGVDSSFKVNLKLQKPMMDQKNIGEKNDDGHIEYYVTKITPVMKSQQEYHQVSTEKKLYYAQPIQMKKEVTTGKTSQPIKCSSNETINTAQQHLDNINFTGSRMKNTLGDNKPSDHLLMRKQGRTVATSTNAEYAAAMSLPENEKYNDSVSSSLQRVKVISQDSKDPPNLDVLPNNLQTKKSQTVYQIKGNNNDQNVSNEQRAPKNNNLSSNSNHKKKIKLAISIKSRGESSKSNHLQRQETIKDDTHIKDLYKLNPVNSNNDEVVLEEELEENTVYSSQKSKKKVTIQVISPTYKVASQPPVAVNRSSSQHLIAIEKVEVPDPYFMTRVPRKPLVEYEAYPTGHHQQVETLETEETSSEVKTVKTYTSYKKSNIKSEDVQSVPMMLGCSPTKSENTKEEKNGKTLTAELFTRNCTSNDEKLLEPQNKNLNINTKNIKLNYSNFENTIKIKDSNDNSQQIDMEVYQSGRTLVKNPPSSHSDKRDTVKHTRIIIGSHHPKKVITHEENKPINNIISNEENDRLKPVEIRNKSNSPRKYSSDHHNQYITFQNNLILVNNNKSDDKNMIGESVIANSQKISMENRGNVKLDQRYESKTKFTDAATSNPSGSLVFTSQYQQNQQTGVLNYADVQEEPTKDPGLASLTGVDREGSPHNQINEQSKTEMSILSRDTKNKNNSPTSQMNFTNYDSISKSEKKISKDTIVYIHLPKSDTRSSSKQFSFDKTENVPITNLDSQMEKETEIKKETESEQLIKTSNKPSKLRKSMSANTYQPPKKIDISLEELISSHNYDSNEEEIVDPSHCNVTFKSETKVELPSGQMAQMKSVAEVKFKPTSKYTHPKPTSSEVRPLVKATKNQATITTEDKCCSAIDLDEIIENPNNGTSDGIDTSSVEDELKEVEYNAVNYSPIMIQKKKALIKIWPSLQFINHWNRTAKGDALLENNGKTVRATLLEDADVPILKGGPLKSDYVFAELHFHWGRKDCCGAEHVIDDQRQSMEAHFLYFKKEYGTLKEALAYIDGLAMVAIQLKVGGPPHTLFGELIKDIALIREAETGVYAPAESLFAWMKETVEEADGYFSYKGTMTSEPPYIEAVTWLVFQKPVIFCCQQSLEFRKLMSPNGELLLKTFRLPRPLNNRPVFYVPL